MPQWQNKALVLEFSGGLSHTLFCWISWYIFGTNYALILGR